MSDQDTGAVAAVPEEERLDLDADGAESNAMDGGDDSDAAEAAFRDPGDVTPLGGEQ